MTTRSILVVWLSLLVMAGLEYAAAMHPWGHVVPVAIGLAMAAIVLMSFMDLRRAPTLCMVFALATLFWILVMLGMGSLDSATRHDIPVTVIPHG